MRAIHLRTEYLDRPLGLGIAAPRLSWHCEGGVKQTAYQIIAKRGDETVWDSGKVSSSCMTHIAYEGAALKSRDRVDWSVTLWDENDVPGEAAETWFELGLLESGDWQAKWISGNYKPQKRNRYPVDCFRKRFTASGEIVKARLYAAARGVYDVTINGKRLEDFILAPGMTDYRKRIQYQTYDVTELLAEENTMELRLADGWFRGSVAAYGVTNVFGTQTSVLAQLEITLSDGRVQKVRTGDSWQWSNDGPIRFADLKDGEVYNATMQPSYRGEAQVVAAPKGVKLCSSDNVPVIEHERFTPTLLPGKVLDFGQNIAGSLSFRFKGKKGQHIHIVCSELYDEKTQSVIRNAVETKPASGWTQPKLIKKLLTQQVSDAVDTPLQEILFTCSGGEDHYKTSFTVFGFRYAQIIGDVDIQPEDFTAITVYSDMEQTGDFSCSDERVNQLFINTRWSMKGNFLDVPTDCPTRERLGWTGDAQVFFNTGAYLMNTAPFFKKWIRDMEDGQYKNGLISGVVPYSGVDMMYKATGGSVGWADAVYLVPYRYYKRFGDQELLRECWPMMKKYADYLLSKIEKDGHYEKGVHLGEWLEPAEYRDKVNGPKAKHPEECTAYLYLTMTTMAEIAVLLGEPNDDYKKAAERAKAAYTRFAELDTDRQAKLVRPLALGLLDGEEKKKVQARLVKAVENYRYRVGTGFMSTSFLLSELTKAGAAEAAYKVLLNTEKPGWLYEVEQGATTIWETWEGYVGKGAVDKGDAGSLNHYSPGAVCQWLFDTVAGIRVTGENRFMIAPIPGGGLDHAGASYVSPYGKVESRWERTDSGMNYIITIPANTAAEIILPDGRRETVAAGTYTFTR